MCALLEHFDGISARPIHDPPPPRRCHPPSERCHPPMGRRQVVGLPGYSSSDPPPVPAWRSSRVHSEYSRWRGSSLLSDSAGLTWKVRLARAMRLLPTRTAPVTSAAALVSESIRTA